MIPVARFADRHEMMKALTPPWPTMVEVGVQFGRFAEAMYEACRPRRLILVDPWRHIGGQESDPAMVSDVEHEARFRECCLRFQRMPTTVDIWRTTSEEAVFYINAYWIEPQNLDAVYLDADHSEAGITADLEMWWPLVRRGGVLAGHDYLVNDWIKVKPAVDAFAEREGLEIMLSAETDWPSWAVVKP